MEEKDNVAPDEIEDNEEMSTLDWKGAAKKLKDKLSNMDMSIDGYEERMKIETLRTRYNAKERTQELFDSINELK